MKVDFVITYIPGTGDYHIITGVYYGDGARYSKPVIKNAKEGEAHLNALKKRHNLHVFDVRHIAALHKQGMERATPIILYRGDLLRAITAFSTLHTAILNAPDSDGGTVQ